ncbi:DsbA family protein [Alphaproteobacteria bacterium]|nr:DsbA family protein [Alphaproteobacteria bacterium]
MKNFKLEVFTDYVCPWCYLGDARVKNLKKAYEIDIELIHFPLHPDTPVEGRKLLDLFRSSQDDIDKKNQNMSTLMKKEGLPFNDRVYTFNSRLAQEIGVWAEKFDHSTSIHDNFFEAYFVHGLNIGLENVILEIVDKSGLDTDEAKKIIQNRLFSDEIDQHWKKSRNYGVTGVPTYVYNNQSIVGAQPLENLYEFLDYFNVPKK